MTDTPDPTRSPAADQQVSRATRVTLVVLGCLALALGGAGAAYASTIGSFAAGDPEDQVWVTVVDDDAVGRTVDCPEDGDGL